MKRKRNSEEASSSYLPSLEATTSHKFDVFLSFRGDTRDKFTSHLYERLTSVGISVFKDDVEMVQGESINEALKTAIDNSRICIPIFSINYASSKACLQELSHMVLQHKSIIPIFYDVGADDVKLKTGLYEKALEDHCREGKVGKEEIEEWEKALLEVGKLLGYNIVNKNEADEITKITREVFKQLLPKYQNIIDHFVKIDNEVESVMKMLDLNSSGCRIIGLCGMGGIGKTTLANVVFNCLSANFNNCCSFIANVRQNGQNNELLKLQQQLYEDLIDSRFAGSINNINLGINMIKKGLENKKFLLVLDDVDDANVLKIFVGDHSRLANGSRIIITTRNKRVLDDLEIDSVQQSSNNRVLLKVYQVQPLDGNRALRLFSRCAFRRDLPPEKFMSLSLDVIFSLGGLPLALEVIGSLLRGRSKKAWEDTMERLKKTPNEKIQTSLMISYHDLHEDEQKIFLDIACYPGGLNKRGAYYMWKSCGWHPDLSIDNLINQSLVKVDERECLWMHDVLKDLGKDIIREEHKGSGREFHKFLHINKNFGRIPNEDRIFLNPMVMVERKYVHMLRVDSGTGIISINDLIGFENVRFLELIAFKIEGNFEGIFPNLRWIIISGVKHFMASNFSPENLVVFEFRCANVEALDPWWRQMKAPKLQVLDISTYDAPNMEWTSSYMEFSSLEVFPRGCSDLVNSSNVPYSQVDPRRLDFQWIWRLSMLVELNFCIPYVIIGLESVDGLCRLQKLHLSFAEFPDHLQLPSTLSVLKLIDCKFPSGVLDVSNVKKKLTDLKILGCDMREIRGLTEMDSLELLTIRRLRNLSSLKLWNCKNLSQIDLFDGLESLTDVSIRDCPSLIGLTEKLQVGRLSSVELWNCQYLEARDIFSGLEYLTRLSIKGLRINSLNLIACGRLESIEVLGGLENLTHLSIRYCPSLRSLPDLSTWGNLKSLTLCKLERLDCINGVGSLFYLRIEDCPSLRSLPDLSKLGNLEYLKLRKLERLECINGVGSLFYLCIEDCPSLRSLPDLSTLGNLEFLRLRKLERLDECINEVGSLFYLCIEDCPSLRSLPDLSTLGNLESLTLGKLERLECINGVGSGNLKSLTLCKLERLECINGVGSLFYLCIEDCPSLRSLPDLSTLGNLEYLRLRKLERLECINGVGSLFYLRIEDCPSLRSLPDLSTLRNLNSLTLRKLERLECINGVGSLFYLCIEDCPSFRNLPHLSTLGNLKSLTLGKLERLKCIKGLTQLEFLKEVRIIGCHSLELDPDDLCTYMFFARNSYYENEQPDAITECTTSDSEVESDFAAPSGNHWSTSMDGNTMACDRSTHTAIQPPQ